MNSLATFIRDNTEPILLEWETFARSLPSASGMDITALRDHAKKMLGVIAEDLDRPQSAGEQSKKAQGKSDAAEKGAIPTAAQEHGSGRAESGFTVEHMVAEFRALRASVIRLWIADAADMRLTHLEDVTRFNEAIDQAIAESISKFSEEVTESKERFLAILGHDLRTPLSAIITSSTFMLDTEQLDEPFKTLVAGNASSARRMNEMVEDLLDFTRTRFGDAMPSERMDSDLRTIIHGVVAEVSASHPSGTLQTRITGDMRGDWDAARLAQALTNLISNAVQHGENSPIRIAAKATPSTVVISIQNYGPVIPKAKLKTIFSATKQPRQVSGGDRRHLGLGLYIVEKIITAHSGSIKVQSSAKQGTVFTLNLPRRLAA